MFEKLRRPGRSTKEGRLKKWFSYFVFGAICLVFVFLAPMGTNLMGEGVLGYVGNEPIRAREFRFLEESIKQHYKSRLEQANNESYSKIQSEIRYRAKAEIVKRYLLVQGAQNDGFFLSAGELRSTIQSIPVFQKEGRFLYSRYLSFLKSERLNPTRFEEIIRKDRLAENWAGIFKKAISSNQLEQNKRSQRHRYEVNFRYALLNAGDVEEEKLEPLVKSKALQKINQFFKKNDVKWEETSPFSLFSAFGIPITQNQNLMEVLIHYLPAQGVIPRLIRQDDKIYIVHVLSFREGETSPQEKQLENLLSLRFDKSVRLLNSWLDFQRQKIKVRLSDKI